MHELRRRTPLLAAFALLAFALPVGAQNTQWSQRTVVRFDQPVQVPGKVLQPGTYVFRLVNTEGGTNNTVQIFNADETQPVATVLTVDTERVASSPGTGDAIFVLSGPAQASGASGTGAAAAGRTSTGGTPALVSWFAAGKTRGQQFVYPEGTPIEGTQRSLRVGSDNALVDLDTRSGSDTRTGAAAGEGEAGATGDTSSGGAAGSTGGSTDRPSASRGGYEDNASRTNTMRGGSGATDVTTGGNMSATSPATGSHR